ncbi:DUF2851 family protein [Marinifilum caeruleilacunae]|uniref:DUF2851 family protein n=1 Tax=Marinifilum caeruleilacunae TaxID=2499076 RepID=A0ABX1X0B2_9BACT|nr:DUF2851 family protein [Marinifilum caeruleilacunae]NOU61844.1 DUF2851 family protein [Marinifilum caeruleilacunae]
MTEEFLQFIWNHKLFDKQNLYSTKGDRIEVLDVGKQNRDAGPDFFDARIQINGVLWAGNVEIHIKSSLWYQHNHQQNSSYDNVILHVVYEEDIDVTINEGRKLPCLLLKFDLNLLENYNYLMHSSKWIPCYDEITSVEKFFVRNWLDRMIFERLERKSEDVKKVLELNKNSWEETFYQVLARYFGMRVNADPFQQLAQVLPLKILAKQKNSLFQIEALLFGQAGMLFDSIDDDYYIKLQSEYQFLSNKYKLRPLPAHRWKWLRLRPGNFPTIRIAQLAALIHNSSALFSKVLAGVEVQDLMRLFNVEVSVYWKTHYQFGIESKFQNKNLGKMTIHTILINAVVPCLFCYGEINRNEDIKEKVLSLLENIPSEKNSIINQWKSCGVEVKTAWHSQALLQLKLNYCDQSKCLHCEFGNRIIRMKNDSACHK